MVATAFLVVSFGLALFAESYRATLVRGERDQAAHRVPLDFVVREDLRRLIPVHDAASLERFRALPGVEVAPVLRLTGGIGRLEGESGITLLGFRRRRCAQLNGWRDSDADASRSELARRIDVPSTLAGVRLSEALTVLRGGRWVATSSLRRDRGAARPLRPARLGDVIPAAARGGRLAGIVLEPATRLQERGADAGQALKGSSGSQFPDLPDALEGWIGVGGAKLDGETIRYTLTNAVTTRIRPRQLRRPRAAARARDPAARRRGGRGRAAAAPDRRRAAHRPGRRHGQPLPRRRRPGGRRRRRGARGGDQPRAARARRA